MQRDGKRKKNSKEEEIFLRLLVLKFYYSLSYKTVGFQTSLRSYGSGRSSWCCFIIFSLLFLLLSSEKIKKRRFLCVYQKRFKEIFAVSHSELMEEIKKKKINV